MQANNEACRYKPRVFQIQDIYFHGETIENMKNPYSKPVEIIYDNSASDMMRFGWVMFEFSLSDNLWIGRDEEGNTWRVQPEQFRDGSISYSEAECDRRWYRCAHPENLRSAKIEMIPRRPVVDYRNVTVKDPVVHADKASY